MATAKFILQGFTASTHIDGLRWLFDLPDVQKVLISVAFVSEGGVERIEEHVAQHAASATVFAGIRNDATSYQGLVRLHRVVDELYTVDTGSRTLIFHPKLYLVRAKEHARLMIGSANLTLAGLNNNIEAGMLLGFDLNEAVDKAEIDEIERLFAASVSNYPDHVSRITDIGDLDELLTADRLVDDSKHLRSQDAVENDEVAPSTNSERADEIDSDKLPRIKLKTKLLRSGMIKHNSSSKRTDEIEVEASFVAAAMPAPTPVVEVGVERDDPAPYVFRPSRRRGEGPRVRAGRLRDEAKARGDKWYFTGEPCIYGHVADRLVRNGKCRECNRLDSERSNRLGLYR
jgi:HKD family nuclease